MRVLLTLLSLVLVHKCYAIENETCGQINKEGTWPWIAMIQVYDNQKSTKYIFGGNLITSNHVLTAAYAVTANGGKLFPSENFIIYLGKRHFYNDDPETQIFSCRKLFVHENYDNKHSNDIALIELDRVIQFSDYVRPICLWQDLDFSDSSGKIGKSIIWSIDKNIIRDFLDSIDVLIASNDTCRFFDRNVFNLAANEKTFCGALPNEKTLCNLHTGNGFCLPNNNANIWQLRGIITATFYPNSKPCGESRFIVFTDLTKHLGWIRQKTGMSIKIFDNIDNRPKQKQEEVRVEEVRVEKVRVEEVRCGTVPLNVSPLIRKGQMVSLGEFPWHTAIYRFNSQDLSYSCGGTLLSKDHIITAAHCLTDTIYSKEPVATHEIQLYLGMYNLGELKTNVQVHLAEKVFIHHQYNETMFYNDIGLIKLRETVTFNHYVRPICLWEDELDIQELHGKFGIIVGWGLNEHNALSKQLTKTNFPIVSLSTCLFQDRHFFSLFSHKNNFCAGYSNGSTACSGDSGGGMYFQRKNEKGIWQLRGIISVGVVIPGTKECHPNHHVLLTDVVKFKDWIKNIIGP